MTGSNEHMLEVVRNYWRDRYKAIDDIVRNCISPGEINGTIDALIVLKDSMIASHDKHDRKKLNLACSLLEVLRSVEREVHKYD